MVAVNTHNTKIQKILLGILSCVFVFSALFLEVHTVFAAGEVAPPAAVAGGAAAQGGVDILSMMGNTIGNMILYVASRATWVGGMILEVSIDKLVLGLGALVKGDLGVAINSAWTTIRDLANLAFIFGFIYLGIRTILDSESADVKRTLAAIIIGALLINFSLFFTKVVIDVSNYIAVETYTTMLKGSTNKNISEKFASLMGIQTFWNTMEPEATAKLTGGGSFAFFVMGAVFLMIAGFVLAAGGILLIVRFVALVLIMVFSPIIFAARVFPQTKKYADDLISKLISYSFFAPAYIFLLLISIHILDGAFKSLNYLDAKGNPVKSLSDALSGSGQLAGNPAASAGMFDVVLLFIISIMFLIFSLKIAQEFGIKGADKAMSLGKDWSNKIRGGIQGFAGRNTVGRLGYAIAHKQEDMRKSDNKWQQRAAGLMRGTGVYGAAHAGAEAKFGSSQSRVEAKKEKKEIKNERTVSGEKAKLKDAIAGGVAAPLGSAGDVARIKKERAVADATTKILEGLSQEEREAIAADLSTSQIEGLDKSTELSEEEKNKIKGKKSDAIKAIYEADRDSLAKASAEHLEWLGAKFLEDPEYAARLTSSQMDDLKKKFTKTEFGNLSKKREDALKQLAQNIPIATMRAGAPATLDKDHILKQKSGEIAKMPAEVLKLISTEIPVNALAKIAQDSTINTVDQAHIRTQLETAIAANNAAIAAGGPPLPNAAYLSAADNWLSSALGVQFGK